MPLTVIQELFASAAAVGRVVAVEGVFALTVFVAALGWGGWLLMPLRLHGLGRAARLALAAALGLGLLGAATLGLGLAGRLHRGSALALVIVGLALATAVFYRLSRRRPPAPDGAPGKDGTAGAARVASAAGVSGSPEAPGAPKVAGASAISHARWKPWLVALLLIPSAGVALYTAALPPGLLWSREGNGYDVLEYHLQAPREFLQQGRITFLPHNVYASFPQQVEALYLLLMHLGNGPYPAAIPAQFLHLLLGAAAVLACAAFAAPGLPRAGAILLVGTTPWVAALAGLAYVEMGLLFFTACAGGLLLARSDGGPLPAARLLLAGLCAGWACGCKYTAVALVALPLLLRAAWLGGQSGWGRAAGLFALGLALGVGPWLARNAALAGNPVYPLAYQAFGGRAWTAEQDEQWRRGHSLPPEQRSIGQRLTRAGRELFAAFSPPARSSFFGLSAALAGLALLVGLSHGPSRWLAVWLLAMLVAWGFFSHMPGRFLLPALAPGAWLLAAWLQRWSGWGRPWLGGLGPATLALLAGILVTALVNFQVLGREFERDTASWQRRTGVSFRMMLGNTTVMPETHPYGRLLPADGLGWVVGDAAVFYVDRPIRYTTVFNRDPWLAQAAERTTAEAVAWLRTQGVTHVVFSWQEIERLRTTYGFPAFVTRAWAADLAVAGLRRIAPAGSTPAPLEVFEVLPP